MGNQKCSGEKVNPPPARFRKWPWWSPASLSGGNRWSVILHPLSGGYASDFSHGREAGGFRQGRLVAGAMDAAARSWILPVSEVSMNALQNTDRQETQKPAL